MMDLKRNKVIDIQLVQSNEVGNSVRMEKEGFVRSLSTLLEGGVDVQQVVTDRHTGVQKYLREEKRKSVTTLTPGTWEKELLSACTSGWRTGPGFKVHVSQAAHHCTTEELRVVIMDLYAHPLVTHAVHLPDVY
uniref:Uncharacterized protein n=1 Tax=Nothobranchius furzeri TaxID=105023 RepID=A0A1A8AVE9_NOTFU